MPEATGVTGITSRLAIFRVVWTSSTDAGLTTMSGMVFGMGRAVPE